MGDYAVSVRVSNARIRMALKNAGFASVAALCRHASLSHSQVGLLLNFKITPLDRNGSYTKLVNDLADALGVLPDDLFSERQKTLQIKNNSSTVLVTEKEMLKLAASMDAYDRVTFAPDILDEIAQEQVTRLVSKELEKLPERTATILKLRYGIGCEEESVDSISDKYEVVGTRIRQIEHRGLNALKGTLTNRLLRQALADIDGAGWCVILDKGGGWKMPNRKRSTRFISAAGFILRKRRLPHPQKDCQMKWSPR